MKPQSHSFKQAAAAAIDDPSLAATLRKIDAKFIDKRREAVEALPEFEAIREAAAEIRDHTLTHLDLYLERFADAVQRAGGTVHFAADAGEARHAVLTICRSAGVRTVTKSKSMIGEEIGINAALDLAGIRAVETDLGEYILQLAGEPPSHIIAPAFHKTRQEVAALFLDHHGGTAPLEHGEDLVLEARHILRDRFFAADAGLTGANFLIAETGQAVLVTNEGNGDLTQSLPKIHIVLASIDKVVPTLEDTATLLRLLARSATGQEITAYTTLSCGPRRIEETVGPEEFHVVLLDNGRSAMLGDSALRPLLRCIRCGACMNHCPIYAAVGGHAYGWVYPGPLGAALDPALIGPAEARHLPQASTLCGACEAVCPVKIPLPTILRHWRTHAFEGGIGSGAERRGLRLWAWLARHPRLYRTAMALARTALRLMARQGVIRRLPVFAGWTRCRDMPAPERASLFPRRRRTP